MDNLAMRNSKTTSTGNSSLRLQGIDKQQKTCICSGMMELVHEMLVLVDCVTQNKLSCKTCSAPHTDNSDGVYANANVCHNQPVIQSEITTIMDAIKNVKRLMSAASTPDTHVDAPTNRDIQQTTQHSATYGNFSSSENLCSITSEEDSSCNSDAVDLTGPAENKNCNSSYPLQHQHHHQSRHNDNRDTSGFPVPPRMKFNSALKKPVSYQHQHHQQQHSSPPGPQNTSSMQQQLRQSLTSPFPNLPPALVRCGNTLIVDDWQRIDTVIGQSRQYATVWIYSLAESVLTRLLRSAKLKTSFTGGMNLCSPDRQQQLGVDALMQSGSDYHWTPARRKRAAEILTELENHGFRGVFHVILWRSVCLDNVLQRSAAMRSNCDLNGSYGETRALLADMMRSAPRDFPRVLRQEVRILFDCLLYLLNKGAHQM